MKLTQIISDIYQVNFKTREELTSTFLRFQEHYESPEFKGKFFTLNEYKKWYISNSKGGKKTGKFTYYEDWEGFNIPSYIFKPFIEGKFDPLTVEELVLLIAFEKMKGNKFYVIGTYGKKKNSTIEHEIAHGLYYINDDYKKEIDQALAKMPDSIKKPIIEELTSLGYNSSVFDDEIQAYLLDKKLGKELKFDKTEFKEAHNQIKNIFYKYYKV